MSVVPVEGLTLGAGIYSGKLGKDTEENPAKHTATRYDFAADYKTEHLNVGGEYFTADDWKTVTSAATDSTDGYSVWVSVPVSKTRLFARYDSVNPSKDLNPDLEDTYYNPACRSTRSSRCSSPSRSSTRRSTPVLVASSAASAA